MSMGGGGGGGTSGTVTWPAYFQDWHETILGSPADMTFDFLDVVNSLTNPFDVAVAYDPNAYVANIDAQALLVKSIAASLNPVTSWANYIAYAVTELEDHVMSTTELAASETAYNAVVDADYNNVILPRFQRGMQDANAVMSSAYVVGEALLEAEVLRKKATFSADLRMESYKLKVDAIQRGVESMMNKAIADNNFQNSTFVSYIDAQRINAVLKKEEHDRNITLEELDTKWDLDLFTYAGNLLAAGHGGVSSSGVSKATAMQSVLGGTMSGASMGTAISPGWGSVFGAAAGFGLSAGNAIGRSMR